MAQDGVAIKCISGDGAREPERSAKFTWMLADRGIKRRRSASRSPPGNGIPERAILQLMVIATSQLENSGPGDQCWMYAIAEAAFKTSDMPHKCLGGETPHEKLTGKAFNYDRFRV